MFPDSPVNDVVCTMPSSSLGAGWGTTLSLFTAGDFSPSLRTRLRTNRMTAAAKTMPTTPPMVDPATTPAVLDLNPAPVFAFEAKSLGKEAPGPS